MFETRDQFIAALLFYFDIPYTGFKYVPRNERNWVYFQFQGGAGECEELVENYLNHNVVVDAYTYVRCLEVTKEIYRSF